MSKPVAVVALLRIRPGRDPEFNAFESRAYEVAARYGGKLERRVAFTDGSDWSEAHVWSFPDLASFQGYRADPDLAALAALRAEAISDTTVMVGQLEGAFEDRH
ncbi:MAG: hypothetical protein OXU20_12160 [Myxococcales bacterium]|nr:hypothetical protein [Myxococcales bacterium]